MAIQTALKGKADLVGLTFTMVCDDCEHLLEMTYDLKSFQYVVRMRSGVFGPWYEERYTGTILDAEAMVVRMSMALVHWQGRVGERYSMPRTSWSDLELLISTARMLEFGVF